MAIVSIFGAERSASATAAARSRANVTGLGVEARAIAGGSASSQRYQTDGQSGDASLTATPMD